MIFYFKKTFFFLKKNILRLKMRSENFSYKLILFNLFFNEMQYKTHRKSIYIYSIKLKY